MMRVKKEIKQIMDAMKLKNEMNAVRKRDNECMLSKKVKGPAKSPAPYLLTH